MDKLSELAVELRLLILEHCTYQSCAQLLWISKSWQNLIVQHKILEAKEGLKAYYLDANSETKRKVLP